MSLPKIGRVTLVVLGFLIISAPVLAVGSSGYENATLSARTLSRANAVVADPEEPSTIAFNPAGLTELEGMQVYAGSNFIWTDYDYKGMEGRPDSDASRTVIPTPYLYGSYKPKGGKIAVGVGANSPFGLITKYSSTGNFRYIAYYNEIKTINYQLSLAYEVTPSLSIGGGWNYYDLSLKQVGKFNRALTGDAVDAPYEYDADGQAQGFNLGLLYKATPKDTLGFYYRSEARVHLKGTMSTHDLTGTMAFVFGGATGGSSNITSADADLTLPMNLTLGWNHQFNEKLDMELDIGWTGWSAYDSFKTTFGTSNAILVGFENLSKDYNDTINVYVGGSYEINPEWTLNGGYYFQEMAAHRANYTNEIPDGDRHGITLGFERLIGKWTLDFNYLIAFSSEVDVDNTAGDTNLTDIDGSYSGLAQIVTTGLRSAF